MALTKVGLFFKKNRRYGVGFYVFDLILNEQHSFKNTVTEHNVENGQPITDHIENELQRGGLTGLVTTFSLSQPGVAAGNRAQWAFEMLETIWQERLLVTVTTILKVYENVAVTDVTVNRSESTGEALSIGVTFKQVKVVKLKKSIVEAGVTVNNMDSDLNRQATPSINAGTAR